MHKILILLCFSFLTCGMLFAETPAGITGSPSQNETSDSPSVTIPGTNPIRIVEPSENAKLPALSATFVCGSAPPNGKLFINGIAVPIHPGGGFLTMVNLSPGQFTINAELQLGDETYRLTRVINVAEVAKPAPVLPLTIEKIAPNQDQELLPGDLVEVTCKGSPGSQGFFEVKGVKRKFPLIESTDGIAGIYRGVYQVGLKDKLKKSKIKITLINNKHQKLSQEAGGTLSLFPNDPPALAEVASPDTVLRTGPALSADDKAGYLMFPPVGTLLKITGRRGDEYRVQLSKTKTVWVSANQVKMLPGGTIPAQVIVGSISVSSDAQSTKVRIPLDRKLPYQVIPDPENNQIELYFYGAYSNTDWINNVKSGIIQSINWFQDDDETYRLKITTIPNSWWGYDSRYQGNSLVLELRTPPPFSLGSSPLAGLTIAVDAGHSPDSGAIGATGYAEKDANLAQALKLKEKLVAKGAAVVMIRQDNEGVPLAERPKVAWRNKADILISLHNNSLGYGGNPFIKHGFGVYYFTPMSLPLAKEVHTAYMDSFKVGSQFSLRDDGLYYGNLALTRSPQMPSILIESGYMIVPEEEADLKNDDFRTACANAIVQGLVNYVITMRPEIPKGK